MKRKVKKRVTWLVVVCCFIAVLFFGYKTIMRLSYEAYILSTIKKPIPAKITGTIDYPDNYKIHGIDVSHYQNEIDYTKLKALSKKGDTINMQFAFIKATEGILLEDPMFYENWKNAHKANVYCGAYHYFKPNRNATLQAKNFIGSVELKNGDLPPVVDIEESNRKSKKEIVKSLKIYIAAIEKEYKVKPIIYSNIKFIQNYLVDDFGDYNFWIANYYVAEVKPTPGISWLFWQHHDKGRIWGCTQNVDINVFKGNKEDLKKILIKI